MSATGQGTPAGGCGSTGEYGSHVAALHTASTSGYVLLGAGARVHRRISGSDTVDVTPGWEDTAVHELIGHTWVQADGLARVTLVGTTHWVQGVALTVTRSGALRVRHPDTVTHRGRRYRIYRSANRTPAVAGIASEYWPGHGVIGSYRVWLGHTYSEGLCWYAALNPTGKPGQVSQKVDELRSRRAAIDWLITHTPPETQRT